MKRLILMRHATAEGLAAGGDFERPLTAGGRLEAERMGVWLRTHGHVPELALCSTALRVRETWAAATRGLEASPPVRWDRALYGAAAADLMQHASEVEAGPECVILVAHNPSISHFAFDLTDRRDPAGRERLRAGFRPATAAVFEIPGEAFADLPESGATLVELVDAQSLA